MIGPKEENPDMRTNITPLHDRVIVKRIDEGEQIRGGIIIPDKEPNFGYGATETFEDLVAAGIIDPAKSTRCALQNAASIAGLMLTTEAFISELQEDGKPRAKPGGMDM